MNRLWQRYSNWLAGLKPRERAMMAVASVALAGFIPFTVALEPQLRESRRLAAQIENQGKVLATLQSDVAALAASNVDPDGVTREQIERAKRQLQELDNAMRAAGKGLVPASEMASLLERLLERNRSLRVVALRTLPGVPLQERLRPANVDSTPAGAEAAGSPNSPAGAAPSGETGVTKYGVELVLQGNYADFSAYLEQIERMPVQMFWSKAVLDAETYPRLTLTLTLFTLGLEAAWLSV